MENTTELVNSNNWIGFDEVYVAMVTTIDNIDEQPIVLGGCGYTQNKVYSIKLMYQNDQTMHLLYNGEPVISKEFLLDKTEDEEIQGNVYTHDVKLDILFPNFKGFKFKVNSILSIENSSLVINRYLECLKGKSTTGEKDDNNLTKKLVYLNTNRKKKNNYI